MRFSLLLSLHVYPAFANDVLWGPSLDTFQGRRWFRGWSRERVPFGHKKRNHILWDLAKCLALFFSSALERLCLFSLPQSSTARDFGGHHCFAERAPSRTAFFTASFVESLQLLREALTPSIAGRPAPRVVRKNAKATWWESPRALCYIDFII